MPQNCTLKQDENDKFYTATTRKKGFLDGTSGKDSTCNAGDPGSISGLGSSPGEGNGITLQYSCLENSMDRGTWLQIIGHN